MTPSSVTPSKKSSPPPNLSLAWLDVWPSVPSSPGVYWFLDGHDRVLYVGKAKQLKNRLTSYKQWTTTTGKTRRLVFEAQHLKFQTLESELEALLVEAELIKTHQPPYNILLKDDKTPLYVQITHENYPRVLMVRKKEVDKQKLAGKVFGPFPSSYTLKEVLRITRHIFPYCTTPRDKHYGTSLHSPCFDYHLGLCQGACIGEVTAEKYQEMVRELGLFLQGKKKDVVKEITAEMKVASANHAFEYAAELRDRVQAIKQVTEQHYRLKPDVLLPRLAASLQAEGLTQLRRLLTNHFSLPKSYPLTRIEGYDVSNIQGTNAAVAQVTFVNGQPAKEHYRLFNIRTLDTPNDFAMMQEALQRRQNHSEWGLPNLIVIDGGKGQLRAGLKVWQWQTPMIALAKKPDRIIFPLFADPEHRSVAKLRYHELALTEEHPALKLLQRIRDEAHRFSKFQHSRRRDKMMLQ